MGRTSLMGWQVYRAQGLSNIVPGSLVRRRCSYASKPDMKMRDSQWYVVDAIDGSTLHLFLDNNVMYIRTGRLPRE